MAVIALISGGITDASTGINDNLLTAGSFTFSDSGASAPEGYMDIGFSDPATGDPVYYNQDDGLVIIGDGEPINFMETDPTSWVQTQS